MGINDESASVYQPSNFDGTGKVYEVISGDSLSKIAKQFNVSVSAIKATNGLTSDTIIIGKKLLIPVDDEYEIPSKEPENTAEISPIIIEPKFNSLTKDESVESITSEEQTLESLDASDVQIDLDLVPQVDYVRVAAESD